MVARRSRYAKGLVDQQGAATAFHCKAIDEARELQAHDLGALRGLPRAAHHASAGLLWALHRGRPAAREPRDFHVVVDVVIQGVIRT